MQGIKHIIFDLGGVILNIDYHLTQEAFSKLGIHSEQGLYSQQKQSEIFDDLEIGKISSAEFVSKIKAIAPDGVQDAQILEAWNAMLLDFPLHRLQILQQLQIHYDLSLLSNTNEIHEKAFNTILQNTCGYPNLGVFFDKVYLSHKVGMRKPNAEIFEFVLNNNRHKAEETLFIDDSIQHIETAKKLGIQCIHLTNGMSMEHDIFNVKN